MPWEIGGKKTRDITARGGKRLSRFVGRNCPYCRTIMHRGAGWKGPAAPSRDHRVPISRGGLHIASNIVVCCRSCNELKGSLDDEEFAAWKDGRASRLDREWWDKVRRENPKIARYPYLHFTRLRLQLAEQRAALDYEDDDHHGDPNGPR